ncbi:uncharacterized protein LOC119167893 [Rhipicephalus microplus]|uniref:uncharacterized protein LOC119167893 n=1 Tax=Rhipicephalus microplus TaxID=6941 RepID=UPI003F6AAED1
MPDQEQSPPFVDVSPLHRIPLVFVNLLVFAVSCMVAFACISSIVDRGSEISFRRRSLLVSFVVNRDITALLFSLIMMVITLTGFVGALRENVGFLQCYIQGTCLLILLDILFVAATVTLPYLTKNKAHSIFSIELIVSYRDNPDYGKLVDYAQETDDDSQMMPDWASEQAVEAVLREMKGRKEWDVLRAIMDGEDEALPPDEADWDSEEATKQRSLHASACCKGHPPSADNVRPCQMSAYQRLDNGITPIIVTCVLTLAMHPVLLMLHRVALQMFPSLLRLLVGLDVPLSLAAKTIAFGVPVGVASLFIAEMREAEDGVATTIAFLVRLLINAAIVVSGGGTVPLLLTSFKRMLSRIVFVLMMYAYDKYSKYLVCPRRTLVDLYASGQCVLPSWCQKAHNSGDLEDTFRRASCLYQKFAMSDGAAMLQSHHEEYGHNLHNFGRDNAIGACVWAAAMVISLLVTFDMAKTVYVDVLAGWSLCLRYMEKRRGGLGWKDALRTAAQGALGEASGQEEAAPSGSSVAATAPPQAQDRANTSASRNNLAFTQTSVTRTDGVRVPK